jgi:hypothetical protein
MDLASAVIIGYIAPPVMFISVAIVKKIRDTIIKLYENDFRSG